VLDTEGAPIPGLYAAGAVSMVWGPPHRPWRRPDRRDGLRPPRRRPRRGGAPDEPTGGQTPSTCAQHAISGSLHAFSPFRGQTPSWVLNVRLAVVTGGEGAIGSAIGDALREAGHHVVVLDRDQCDLGDAEAGAIPRPPRSWRITAACDVLVHAAAAVRPLHARRARPRCLPPRPGRERRGGAPARPRPSRPGMAERHWGRMIFVVSDTVFAPPRAPSSCPTSPARPR